MFDHLNLHHLLFNVTFKLTVRSFQITLHNMILHVMKIDSPEHIQFIVT